MTEQSETPTSVTVNLTPHTIEALDYVCERTGDTQTDAINQSIQVHAEAQEMCEVAYSVHANHPSSLIGRVRAWLRSTSKAELRALAFVFGGVGYLLTTLALMLTFGG